MGERIEVANDGSVVTCPWHGAQVNVTTGQVVGPSAPQSVPAYKLVVEGNLMHIASLLASATEIVCALGLGDRLVGISHECDYPPEVLEKPRLSRARFDPTHLTSGAIDAAVRRAMREHGNVYEVDAERLAGLRPDLILTQAVCEVCAVPTASA